MKRSDFRSVLRLTNHEQWGFTTRDLRRMQSLEPKGCLVATLDSRPVGLTTAISYGNKLGWIGNVVVDKNHRGTGIGSGLVESAVRYLQRLRVKSIGLYCYPENRPMYERLNFRRIGGFVTLSISARPARIPVHRDKVPISQILKLDKELFGADRTRLLQRLLREFPRNWAWIASKSQVSAYSVVKEYRRSSEIGPSVLEQMNRQNVEALLQSSIALARRWPLEMSVSDSTRIVLETTKRLGFRFERKGMVMSLGALDEVTVSPATVALGFLDKG